MANSAEASLISAMSKFLQDTETADFTLICGDKEWKLHSNILAMRSPFFKGVISNNMAEKMEMKCEIKHLHPSAMNQVINFMYGIPIEKEKAPFGSLLEASVRFQMDDLKRDVVNIGWEGITFENAVELGKLAELYDIEELLHESAEFIVKNDIPMNEENFAPKLTIRVLSITKKEFEESKQREKESQDRMRNMEMIQQAGGATVAAGDDAEYIKLKVRLGIALAGGGQDYNEIHFRVKQTTQMGMMKRKYCERFGIPIATIRFLFDGRRINDDQTTESLAMINDDVIEVYNEQIG